MYIYIWHKRTLTTAGFYYYYVYLYCFLSWSQFVSQIKRFIKLPFNVHICMLPGLFYFRANFRSKSPNRKRFCFYFLEYHTNRHGVVRFPRRIFELSKALYETINHTPNREHIHTYKTFLDGLIESRGEAARWNERDSMKKKKKK